MSPDDNANNDREAEMPQPCDEWRELVAAADCAGQWSARQLACCCSPTQLARGGSVNIYVEPADSPVAAWLQHHDFGTRTNTGLLVPVVVTAESLRPAAWATRKSPSLLVRHAYAAAFCTVLTEQAGVVAEISFDTAPAPMPHLTSALDSPSAHPDTELMESEATEQAFTSLRRPRPWDAKAGGLTRVRRVSSQKITGRSE